MRGRARNFHGLSGFDVEAVRAAGARVPVRAVAGYMLACVVLFAVTWLRDIVPVTISHTLPRSFAGTGLTQNPIYVLDFAFTSPLLTIGAAWLWQRRGWGYVIGGIMIVMLTVETAGIAIDQTLGHLHDASAGTARDRQRPRHASGAITCARVRETGGPPLSP